jgi:membrane protein YqaA with SNARE-associated domain
MSSDGTATTGRLARGIRVVLRNDASAYGYSLLATSAFGVASAQEGPPSVARVFVFVVASASAFALAEMVGSDFFRQRIRPERSDIVLLASALSPLSALAALGTVALIGLVVDGWLTWLVGPFVGTTVYILLTGANMAAASFVEERNPPQETA